MSATHHRVQTIVNSPLGNLRLVASAEGLAGIWFVERQRHAPADELLTSWPTVSSNPLLDTTEQQLDEYFHGRRRHFDLPLDLQQGTDFQRSVWLALLNIPVGETTSYRALASSLGNPRAMRAVGAAVGRNPLGIVVPCHRVLGSSGALTGYAGGLDRKQALLLLERSGSLSSPCLSH